MEGRTGDGRSRVGAGSAGEGRMFKLLLISVVVVPVLLGIQAAKKRSLRRGFFLLLGFVLTYDVFYFVMLYYVRLRWVGWGSAP